MPKYIKHYIQKKAIQKFNEKNNRKILMFFYLKKKFKYKRLKKKLLINKTFARAKSRCILNGRAKSYYSKFKLSRHSIKKLFCQGQIPGLILSSW